MLLKFHHAPRFGQQPMPTKEFDHTVSFYQVPNGLTFPIVTVTLIQSEGNRVSLPLLFDTGASYLTLRRDAYAFLELERWDIGRSQLTVTGGSESPTESYLYDGYTFEVFGKTLRCPVVLMELPENPLFVGLLGREAIFQEFGFGFWEKTHELYVGLNP